MIVHVWRRAVAAEIGPVVVACGDRAIADAVEAAGGRAVLTDPHHPTGSDRIHEAIARIDPSGLHDAVINVQGDLPLLDPAAVRVAVAGLADPETDIATLGRDHRGRSGARRYQRQQGRRRLCRSGAAGARALFQQGRRAVGARAALRAYRALRLSPRRARTLCRAAARRPRAARASRTAARPRSRHAHLGQPDRPRPPRRAGRHAGRPRPRPPPRRTAGNEQ